MRVAVLALLLAAASCKAPQADAISDEQTAIRAATQLCHWDPASAEGHLHAELKDGKWRVWDDRGGNQAYLNKRDGGTFVCIGL